MEGKKQDRRVQRTRELLLNAFIETVIVKGYDKVTVQDIVDQANVGRTTFYAHFHDKDDLLSRSIEGMLEAMLKKLKGGVVESSDLLPIEALFEHVGESSALHQAFGSGDAIRITLHKQLVDLIRVRLIALYSKRASSFMANDALSHYLAGAAISLLFWWLGRRGGESPKKMAERFQCMVAALCV